MPELVGLSEICYTAIQFFTHSAVCKKQRGNYNRDVTALKPNAQTFSPEWESLTRGSLVELEHVAMRMSEMLI
jgi:hypothetical protein